MKTVKIFNIIQLSKAFDSLLSQEVLYPIQVAYKIIKAKNAIKDIENLTIERIGPLLNSDKELTESEVVFYDSVVNTEVEVDIPDITLEELTNNNQVVISLDDMDALSSILN